MSAGAMTWSSTVLLYRHMLTESKKFPNYMFRTYALRRIRDAFRENQNVSDAASIDKLLIEANQNLQLIKRQAHIGSMYKSSPFAMDSITEKKRNEPKR